MLDPDLSLGWKGEKNTCEPLKPRLATLQPEESGNESLLNPLFFSKLIKDHF